MRKSLVVYDKNWIPFTVEYEYDFYLKKRKYFTDIHFYYPPKFGKGVVNISKKKLPTNALGYFSCYDVHREGRKKYSYMLNTWYLESKDTYVTIKAFDQFSAYSLYMVRYNPITVAPKFVSITDVDDADYVWWAEEDKTKEVMKLISSYREVHLQHLVFELARLGYKLRY